MTAWWWRRAFWSNSPRSLLPLVSLTCSSCFKVLFTKKKLNNHIVEIHKIQKHELSLASWGSRSPATRHPSLFARTVQPLWQELLKKALCLSTCRWSMDPAIKKKYCKTDIWSSFRHTKGSALSSAPGPAGVEGKFVREIMLLLDWISLGGQSTIEREA